MTREFSEAEREQIRQQLLDLAEEHFARYGLGKTTIADLTDPVGIANSTFYSFFDSKEALYVEVLEAQAEAISQRLLADSFDRYEDPQQAIEAFLKAVCTEIETNPLTRQLIAGGEIDRLRTAMGPEATAQSRAADIAYFLPYIEVCFERGDLRGPDPATVAHAIRAVTFLTLHREDIGTDRYEAVRDLVIESFAVGLTIE